MAGQFPAFIENYGRAVLRDSTQVLTERQMVRCTKCGYAETAAIHGPAVGGTKPWGHAFQGAFMPAHEASAIRKQWHQQQREN